MSEARDPVQRGSTPVDSSRASSRSHASRRSSHGTLPAVDTSIVTASSIPSALPAAAAATNPSRPASSHAYTNRSSNTHRSTTHHAAAQLLTLALRSNNAVAAGATSSLTLPPPPTHTASKRVIDHMGRVHNAILAQISGKSLFDDDADLDTARRLKREDAKQQMVANPMLNLPGKQMMMTNNALSQASFQEATSAALLAVAPRRKQDDSKSIGSAARRRPPPTVNMLLTRQEWIKQVLEQRWREVQDEIDSTNEERQQKVCPSPTHLNGGPTAATSTSTSIPPISTALTKAPSTAAGTSSTLTTARTATAAGMSAGGHKPAHSKRASMEIARIQSRTGSATHMRRTSTAMTIHSPIDDESKTESDVADPDLDPIWDLGEGSPAYKSWFRSEIRNLSHSAYDDYLAQYHARMEFQRDRVMNGPRAINQYDEPNTQPNPNQPNEFHARAHAVMEEWKVKYPAILQTRQTETASSSSSNSVDPNNPHARSKPGKPHNPVLVPVIERRLMDLSKPLDEMMLQIEREERGGVMNSGGTGFGTGGHGFGEEEGGDGTNHTSASTNATNPSSTLAPRPLSPRTEYNQKQSLTLENLVELLMKLDESALQAIRAEFEQCGVPKSSSSSSSSTSQSSSSTSSSSSSSSSQNGLLIYDFVLMACTHISSCSASLKDLQSLIEMFREIDVNGDALCEWDEFTSHLVMLASTYGHDSSLDQIPHFVPIGLASHEDNELHSRPCEIIKWCGGSGLPGVPGLNKILLIERNSRLLKVYNTELTCLQTIRCRASILAVEYLPPRQQIVVSCTDRTLQFFSCKKTHTIGGGGGANGASGSSNSSSHPQQSWIPEYTWQLSTSQTCLEYAGKNLFTLDGLATSTGSKATATPSTTAPNASAGKHAKKPSIQMKSGSSSTHSNTPSGLGILNDVEELGGSNTQLNFTILYTGDTNGRITCWNLDRGEEKFRIENAHSDVIMEMKLLTTLSNSMLVTTGLDSVVKVWDTNKGTSLHVLAGHTKAPLHIAFHPDLKLLITGGLDRYALVWPNPKTLGASLPVMRLSIPTPMAHVIGIEVLLGSPEVVLGDSTGGFFVFDLRTGLCIQSFHSPKLNTRTIVGSGMQDPGGSTINSLCVIPKAGLLVAAGPKLFSFKRTTGVLGSRADDGPVRATVWDPHALVFITASDSNLKVWNGLNGALAKEEKSFIRVGSRSRRNANGGVGGGIDMSALEGSTFQGHLPTITTMVTDDRHRRAYVGLSNGVILALNINTGAVMGKLIVSTSEVSSIIYHSSTKQIISGSWDGNLCWMDDLLTGITRKTNKDQTKDIIAVGAAPEYKIVASIAADSTLCLYDDRQGPLLMKWNLPSPPTCMVFLSPYPFLLVADQNGGISFFDIQPPFSNTALFYIPELNLLPTTRPPSPTTIAAAAARRSQEEIEEAAARTAAHERRIFDRTTAATRTRPNSAIGAAAAGNGGATRSTKSSARGNGVIDANEFDEKVEDHRLSNAAISHMTDNNNTTNSSNAPHPPPHPTRKHPSIISMTFDNLHRNLLLADETGYIKVYPLGHVLLRKFHSNEVTTPSSTFYAKVFKPVPTESIIIRSGWTTPVVPAQPRVIEKEEVRKETQSMADRLAALHLARESAPVAATSSVLNPSRVAGAGARRGSVTGGGSNSGSQTPVSGQTAVSLLLPTQNGIHMPAPSQPAGTAAGGAAGVAASPSSAVIVSSTAGGAASTPNYASASLMYPPPPTRHDWSPSVIKSWTIHDSIYVQSQLRPSLQIQAHQDSVHGVDVILDTLYEPTLVSWSFDGSVRLWNLSNGERVGSLMQGHNGRTSHRDEKWHFYFDLRKHRALEAQFYSAAFKRPPSPESYLLNDEDEVAQIREKHRALITAAEQATEEEKSRAATHELLRLTEVPTPALTTRASPISTGGRDAHASGRDFNPTDSTGDVVHTGRGDVSTSIAAAFEHVSGSRSESSSMHVKGDTFLTDLDGATGKSPAGSHKKRKLRKKRSTPLILEGENAAAEAAARLAAQQADSRQGSRQGATTSAGRRHQQQEPAYSTSVTPITSPQRERGMAYSQSQPVLSHAGRLSSAGSSSSVSSKQVAFRESPPPMTPIQSGSPLASSSSSSSAFTSPTIGVTVGVGSPLTLLPIPIPKRTSPWKAMPGATSVQRDLTSYAPPPKQVERGTAVRVGQERLTPLKMLKVLTSSPPPPPAAAQLIPIGAPAAASSVGSPLPNPSRVSPIASLSSPVDRPNLIRLESRTLPLPSQLRGRPRLGRRSRPKRINHITGEEETDSEAEREEAEREEEERKKHSWWTPTNPAFIRMPSTLKKTIPADDDAADGHDPTQPHQVHTLYVSNKSLSLSTQQAASVVKLSQMVSAAESILSADTDKSMDVNRLEKRHRDYAEATSEYYNFKQ